MKKNVLILSQYVFIVMRYSFLFIVCFTLGISMLNAHTVDAQGTKQQIVVQATNQTYPQLFREIEQQSEFRFVYNHGNIPAGALVNLKMTGSLKEVLNQLERTAPIEYKVVGKNIVVTYRPKQESGRIIGLVKSVNGEPLIGATLRIAKLNQSANTDNDGRFTFNVPPGTYSLSASYMSYQTEHKEAVLVTANGQSVADFTLVDDIASLSEVVIIGYGTAKRSDLTGSVTDVSARVLQDQPVTSIDQQLVGRVAGMQVSQGSGAPGAGTTIQIRGSGSLGAGNDPLYVVDGMPYASESSLSINPLSFINPADIENISVLKDASSTAIYGSRGANGVILITTKNAGKAINEINVSGYAGISSVPQKGRPQMMNAGEFALYQRDRMDIGIRKQLNREPMESDYPEVYQNLESMGEGTNWYDLILRNAAVQNYTIDLQKSMDRSRFYLGFGYYNQQGTVHSTGFKRYSTTFNYTFNVNDKIQVQASLRPTYVDQDRVSSGSSRNDPMSIALWAPPVMDAYDENGNLIPYIQMPATTYSSVPWSFPNPLFMLQNGSRKYNELRNLGNVSFQWEIMPGLRFKTGLSTVYNTSNYNEFAPSTVGSPNAAPRDGSAMANRSRGSGFNWLIENTLSYDRAVGVHALSGIVGYTTQKATARSLGLNAGPFDNDLLETINAAPGITSWSEGISEWSMISYLGRINYTYDSKYFLTATLRSDGSSRFGSKNRFALFPSAAVAWRISEENFMSDISAIDQLKIRATYGRSGNNNIGNYAHLASVNNTQYVFDNQSVSAATISLSNPYLGWEESEQYDIGLDLGLLNNRISFTADLYRKRSVKMLLNDYIPTITGFSNQLVNKGNVENRGLELAVNATPFQGDFNWNVGFNIAFNRNKILATNENGDAILSGSVDGRASNVSEVGQPIGMFYGFVLDGVYSQADVENPNVPKYAGTVAGYPKYRDLNGDGIVQEILDYTVLGSPHPDFIFGFNTNMSYKNIDLSVALNGRQGGYIMNGIRQTTDNMQGLFNVGKEWADRYRNEANPGDGIHAAGPQIVHRVNTLWLEDASYLRLTNLTLGYTIPTSAWGNHSTVFKNFRLYASVQNLFTITNYKGANPEGQASNVNSTLSPGFDTNAYPVPRTITMGLNVKF